MVLTFLKTLLCASHTIPLIKLQNFIERKIHITHHCTLFTHVLCHTRAENLPKGPGEGQDCCKIIQIELNFDLGIYKDM